MYKLYGIPASLWTGKARSYLRKQSIPFVEYGANHPDFLAKIVPAVGRWIIPVVEMPDGELVQDGADIIDHFESSDDKKFSVVPDSGVLRTLAYLFELFGGEGMLRPAMHFRWNFDEHNLDFLREDFSAGLATAGASVGDAGAVFDNASGRMRKAAIGVGVTEDTIPLIEESYAEFLALFSAHLSTHPYLLGDKPTVGDFGLIAPLFAHLGRDPFPTLQMRQKAPKVARWVERMNAPEAKWIDHPESQGDITPAAIPDTLKSLMRYVSEEYLPEIAAHVSFANHWLSKNPDLKEGTNGLENPAKRFIGLADFTWRGTDIKTLVMPYRFYLLQRVQDSYDSCTAEERDALETIFAETGLSDLLTLKTLRRVERKNYLEVWGPLR